MTNLQLVGLFSGVGGGELAMHRAGIETVSLREVDQSARAVLSSRFPGVPIFEDVRKVTGDALRDLGAVPERSTAPRWRRADLAAEIENLHQGGVSLPEILRRTGTNASQVVAALRRAGRHDLARATGAYAAEWQEREASRGTTGARPVLPPGDPRHGTGNGYRHLGCRCRACKDWNAERMRQRRRAGAA
jgi:hypothetical protein